MVLLLLNQLLPKSSMFSVMLMSFNFAISNIWVVHCCVSKCFNCSGDHILNHYKQPCDSIGISQTQQKRLVYNLNGFLCSYTAHIPDFHICQVEYQKFSILVIFVTFSYHLFTRTVIHQPHTDISHSCWAVYQVVKSSFFTFCCGQTFSSRYWSCFWDTSADIPSTWSLIHWIYVNGNTTQIIHVKPHGHPYTIHTKSSILIIW